MSADAAIIGWFGAGGLACIAMPMVVAWTWHRRTGEPYRVLVYGAGMFALAQFVLRLPWQIPLALWVRSHPQWEVPFWMLSGLTAGLFEEVARYVGYRKFPATRARPEAAVMYGLGSGAIESMLLVGVQLVAVAIVLALVTQGVVTDPRVGSALRAAAGANPFGLASSAVVERMAAITLQVALALVVRQAIVRREWRWLALAVAIHALVDFGAVFLARRAEWPIPLLEAVIVVAAAGTLLFGLHLVRREPR